MEPTTNEININPHITDQFTFSSVQFSHSVVSDSLRPHEWQHARPPCPSPTPGVHSDSRPLSRWCHPAISSSVVPFFCPQSLPASESFPMSQLRMRWPKYWSFSFSIIPSKEIPGLISSGLLVVTRRRQWQPTPVFLPRESQGQGSLVGWRLWGRTESDTTEAT